MEQAVRNKLRNVVTQCRKLLEESIAKQLEGQFGILAGKKDAVQIEDEARMSHLSEEDQQYRRDLLDHFEHIKARDFEPKDALDQLIREIAFTHLNRLCAYKMMEARDVYVGGQKFREAVSRGLNSNGFKFYLADHPDDERLFNTGQQELAYRHFLDWLGGLLSEEIGVLFNPNDPANRLYPRQKTLDDLIGLLNGSDIGPEEQELRKAWPKIWEQDETIGWVYQYFTPNELRNIARKESAVPRNSYELAFRNQFFTPRYVVEFLTDNTLGRTWYEMRKGSTKLKNQCRYMVLRPNEIFLDDEQQPPEIAESQNGLSQEELVREPVHIPHRPKKDPRELRILDPACGSGHFLLYCFDLLLTIYEEAYDDPHLGPALQQDYSTLDDLCQNVPRLILAHNLHGIDIDVRCSQIAALALWLRCQRAFKEMGVKKNRPTITRSHLVCAEPMPGEEQMLTEFVTQIEPKLLGHLVETVFDKMKLAGEAGSLLQIEEEVRQVVAEAKKQWLKQTTHALDSKGQALLFTEAEMDRLTKGPQQRQLFDVSDISDAEFFEHAERRVVDALRAFAESSHKGAGLQRRLFADDAERGFAFVDVCRQRFDVVLMNPPFGLPSDHKEANKYITKKYPSIAKNLACAFFQRAFHLSLDSGMTGSVSDRSVFVRKNYKEARQGVLARGSLDFADLGWEVLDEANVEASSIVVRNGNVGWSCFFDVRKEDDKATSLQDAISKLYPGCLAPVTFLHHNDEFVAFPNTAFVYWVPRSVFFLFVANRTFDNEWAVTKQGTAPADTPRFVRLWWEVPMDGLADRSYARLAHGGSFSPAFRDYHFAIWWRNDGEDLKKYVCERYPYLNGNPAWVVKNERDYFRPGLHFGKRCHCLSLQAMPSGMVFTNEGHAVFANEGKNAWVVCGLLNTRIYRYIINTYCGQHKHGGYIDSLPSFTVPLDLQKTIGNLAEREWMLRAEFNCFNEEGNWFVGPAHAYIGNNDNLTDAADEASKTFLAREAELLKERLEVEEQLARAAGVVGADWEALQSAFFGNPFSMADDRNAAVDSTEGDETHEARQPEDDDSEGTPEFGAEQFGRLGVLCAKAQSSYEDLTKQSLVAVEPESLRLSASQQLSYALGVVVGRWDVRCITGDASFPTPSGPFEPLPVCAPGMLQGQDGLPARETPENYPLEIDWDGVVADDRDHHDDIVRRVRDVLEIIWKGRSEAIEQEACEILGVKTLRDYFRKSGKGAFWDDHVKRYSKSRRKAPIYWLLQSSRKNYGLWLYYHRLDKDMLFKALLNYVEPKIQREENRLSELRSQKSSASESGKGTKKFDRGIERQEDLLSEVRDFEEKLRKVADLYLVPDLNDGVVLNIAPLHELVPWKEAKKYWNELLAGKYEWSSIGKQLREKGLVK